MKKIIEKTAKKLGYELVKAEENIVKAGYQLYDYNKNGTLDYEKYRDIQVQGNKRKINNSFFII